MSYQSFVLGSDISERESVATETFLKELRALGAEKIQIEETRIPEGKLTGRTAIRVVATFCTLAPPPAARARTVAEMLDATSERE